MGPSPAKPLRTPSRPRPAGWVSVTSALLACVVGCNGNARRMEADLYQRELRLQEDEIYRLEDYLDEYQAIVRGYRCEVADLRRELADAREATPVGRDADDPDASPPPPPGQIDPIATPIEIEDADDLTPPTAPFGEASETAPTFGPPVGDTSEAPAFEAPASEAPSFKASAPAEALPPPPAFESADARPMPPMPYPDATPPATDAVLPASHETPPPRLTLRSSADGSGVHVVTVYPTQIRSPRSFGGSASLMLTDVAASGRQRRLARWDFDAAETEAVRVADGAFEFPVLLPESLPPHNRLLLWVRLEAADGRKTLGSIDVEPTPAGGLRTLAATEPRRLPAAISSDAAGDDRLARRTDLPSNESSGTSEGWRPSGRRFDGAVQPAAYAAPTVR